MSTLPDFLLARIAEDEQIARRNTDHPEYDRWDAWSVERRDDRAYLMRQVPPAGRKTGRLETNHADVWLLDQVARWDPDRVLAECEAKRRLIEQAREVSAMDQQIEGEWGIRGSVPWDEDEGIRILRILAAPFADHPDFRPEWRV